MYLIIILQIYKFYSTFKLKMPTSHKRNKQKRAKEAKSCMKVPSRKITRLEHARQNTFKLLTNPVNQNCSEFVILNKQEFLQKIDSYALSKIKNFGKQGICFYFFIILVPFILCYGIYDVVKLSIFIFIFSLN